MKKYLLFFTALVFTTTLVAQELPKSLLAKFQHHPQKHKTQFVFDGMVKIDSMQMFYSVEGNFMEMERSLFEYTGQGQLQKATYYELDYETTELLIADKDIYFYENGQLSYEVDYYYDHDLDIWIMDDSVSYTYQDGLLVQEDYYWYDQENDEMDHDEITYYYYTGDLLDSAIVESWDGSEFVLDTKDEYLYDGGKMTSYIHSYYHYDLNDWVFANKTENSWDGEEISEIIEMSYDETDELWINDSKYTYTWQSNGNLDEEIDYSWDEIDEIWVEEMKMYGFYTNDVIFSDMVLPFAEGEEGNPILFFEHQVDSVYMDFYTETGDWEHAATVKFHYSEFVGLNDPMQKNNLQVDLYPNPANNTLHVKTPFIHETQGVITDNLGRVVQIVNLKGECSVNVSALPGGVYFIKIADGKYAGAAYKFVVE